MGLLCAILALTRPLSELERAPGYPTLAWIQLRSCQEPWESIAQDPAKALLRHLGKPWMTEQGGVHISRWLL